MMDGRPSAIHHSSFKISVISIAVVLFIIYGLSDKPARAFSTGPPASHTGAPGEENCTSCHTSFPLNSGPGSVRITGLPGNYTPGQEVTVSLTVVHPDGFLYGFQVTAVNSAGAQVGTLLVTDTVNTQSVLGAVGGNTRTYIQHTFQGAFPVEFDQRTWTFKWTAPQTNAGPVTFYAAGNGGSGDGEPIGDHIYTKSLTVYDQSPAISPTSQSFTANGGTGSVNLTVPAGYNWTAVTTDSFITITSGASGSGSGTINFSVAQNTSTSTRSGTITIAGRTFSVLQGAAFLDVPVGHPFYTEIGKLSARGVTLGCGGGNYCPDQAVTREQMAAFIMRARGEFNPPTPPMQRFDDVPPSNPFYNFIDRLAVLQITLGCFANPPLYCPTQEISREQMAAFIIRALGEFNPPTPPMQRFQDVPPSNPFYNFIDRMAVLQITLGCSTNPSLYCPTQSVTRAQMAAFLVRAFNL